MRRKSFLLFLLVLFFVASCGDKKSQTAKAPIAVSVFTVADAGSEFNDYVGSVVERTGTSLSFEVPGKVVRLLADCGDMVRKGQLLATVDPTSLRDAHEIALTTLRQAKDAHRRFEPLHKQGVISDIRWVEIQTQLEQAQSAERLARTQMGHTSLVAPFSGVISERNVEQGTNVITGQPVYRLVDISSVDVKTSIPEDEISQVKVGSKAIVVVAALGGRHYEATVREKGIEANAVSHTYDVKLAIANADGKLMPGMVCGVSLDIKGRESQANLPSVPLNAIKLDSDNRRFVWLAVGGKAKQQYVTIGDFVSDGVSVVSGLKRGDKVVTDGSQKISEGMAIKY